MDILASEASGVNKSKNSAFLSPGYALEKALSSFVNHQMVNNFTVNIVKEDQQGMLCDQSTHHRSKILSDCPLEANHELANIRFRAGMARSVTSKQGSTEEIPTMGILSSNLIDRLCSSQHINLPSSRAGHSSARVVTHHPRRACLDQGSKLTEESFYLHFEAVANLDLDRMSEEEIIDMVASNRVQSIALQQFIVQCWRGQSTALLKCLLNNLAWLIVHPWGSYVVKHLARVDERFRDAVEPHCREHFGRLIRNEYSSRVLELLISKNRQFRLFVCQQFNLNPSLAVSHVSTVFLAAAVIKSWDSSHEGFFIWKLLEGAFNKTTSSRFIKRLLIHFIETANNNDLSRISTILNIKDQIVSYLNDKLMTLIVLEMVYRNHRPSITLLSKILQQQLNTLAGTRFFKLLMTKCLSSDLAKETTRTLQSAFKKGVLLFHHLPELNLDGLYRSVCKEVGCIGQ